MADHVAVGVVDDVDLSPVLFDRGHELSGDLSGTHLRLEVVRRYLRAWDEASLLPRFGRLRAAVQEERDVSVLLGLGGMELPKPRFRQHISQHAAPELLGERHRRRDLGVVFRETHKMH